MICENTVCDNEVVGRRKGALYCCPNCKRQAEIARRSIKHKGVAPVHRGTNTGRTLDKREYRLNRLYGITSEQYNLLLEKQSNCCAVCNKDASTFKNKLAVDHNHQNGEIRGLLCFYCNHRLVGRWRDSHLLRKIADYVEQGTGWFVPEDFKTGRTRKRKRK